MFPLSNQKHASRRGPPMPKPPVPAETPEIPPALLAAVRRVLLPLVRLLIRHGLTYPQLAELLKGIYVEAADTHFRLDSRRPTDSRISLLTGVHRKDVRRLRASPEGGGAPASVSLGAQIAARWAGDSRYRDAAGTPKPLARLRRDGGEHSFEALVAGVNRDIRPRAVLDEWLRLGVVALDAQDRVVLRTGAFVPVQGFDEKAWYLGRNVHDHLAAAAHNLEGAQPPLLERCVYYDRLRPQSVTELADLARAQGMAALQAVNARALHLQERDAGSDDAMARISFGAYFYAPAAASGGEGD
jgi:hypothetical protein